MLCRLNGVGLLLLIAASASANEVGDFKSAMMGGLHGARTQVALTIGETIASDAAVAYAPPGVLDGLGAYALNADTVRVLANHELKADAGFAYELGNGTRLRGARVSYFDIDKASRRVVAGGLAFDGIRDREGEPVTQAAQLDFGGLHRFCSAALFEPGQLQGGRGFVDRVHFSGEETSGGALWALDVAGRELWAVPAVGRGAWENVAVVDTGNAGTIGLLLGDDRSGSPLYLYTGTKGVDANGVASDAFLARNGLARGQLHVWAAEQRRSPQDFHGSGKRALGRWVAVANYAPTEADKPGWDALGYADQRNIDAQAAAVGAFKFSRPEDLSTDPADPTRVVFASTGRGSSFPADAWGTLYTIDLDFEPTGQPRDAVLEILYDADEPGRRDAGLRSPDNLDWADDGAILVQEDRANKAFGKHTGEEASIWRLAIANARVEPSRVAQMNRSALPAGQTDSDPDDIGDWESSGILDVSRLFNEAPGSLFVFTVQAHSLRDGIIDEAGLVQGGQLLFLDLGAVDAAQMPSAKDVASTD